MPRLQSHLGASDLRLLDRFWREPVSRVVLPNGLTVLLKPDRSAALASVQVWVRTGSIHEGAQLGAGLSHYLEHMLFKGTERRAGREISAAVQAHGGYINAYTTFDRTVYYIDLPSEHAAVAIDLLADLVLHATLPADEAAKEKGVILREIAMTQDDPDDRLWRSLFSTAFREHPYRHPVIGYREVFSAVDRDGARCILPCPIRAEQPGRDRGGRHRPRRRPGPRSSGSSAPRPGTAGAGPGAGGARAARPARGTPLRGCRAPRGPPSPGGFRGSRTATRLSSTCSRWCWATGTARSSGRNCGRRRRSSTRSTRPAGIRGRAGCSASRSPATRTSAVRGHAALEEVLRRAGRPRLRRPPT